MIQQLLLKSNGRIKLTDGHSNMKLKDVTDLFKIEKKTVLASSFQACHETLLKLSEASVTNRHRKPGVPHLLL